MRPIGPSPSITNVLPSNLSLTKELMRLKPLRQQARGSINVDSSLVRELGSGMSPPILRVLFGMRTNSANPPSTEDPISPRLRHRLYCPISQYIQFKQGTTGESTTRVPSTRSSLLTSSSR